MSRLAAPVGAVLTFVGALAPLLLLDATARSWAFRVYALLVGVLAANAVIRRIDAAGERTAEEAPARVFHEPSRVATTARTWWFALTRRRARRYEGSAVLVNSASLTAGSAHHRLRPVLTTIADERLRARHGITITDPRAAGMFSPATWDLLRPDRRVPDDRLAPGPTIETIAAALDDLERC